MTSWFRRRAQRSSRPARHPDVQGFRLDDLPDTNGSPEAEPEWVAEVVAAPPLWRNCLYRDVADLESPDELDLTLAELLGFVEVGADHGEWSFGLDDEVKPVIDTGLDEDLDPVIAVLRADPRVTLAAHPDREWYCWRTATLLTAQEAAALTLRALVAGHHHALSMAGLPRRGDD